MARATMAVVEDSSQGEVVEMEAVEVSNEVAVVAKEDTSRRQRVFRPSHSTRQAALQLSEATMAAVWVVEVPAGVAATITSTGAVASKEQQVSLLMAEMEATITSTSPGSSTMSSTGRASSSTKVAPATIASSSTRASSRSQLE